MFIVSGHYFVVESVTDLYFITESLNVNVKRSYCGTFMTSLEMAGVSLTVMHVSEQVIQYLGMFSNLSTCISTY